MVTIDLRSMVKVVMTRILVTGGSGFIGRPVVKLLSKLRYEVDAPSSTVLNILDARCVRDYISELKPTHLLHLAWLTTPGVFFESSNTLQWVEASLSLARTFSEHGGWNLF